MINNGVNSYILKSKITILRWMWMKLLIIIFISPMLIIAQNIPTSLDTNDVITDSFTKFHSSKSEVKNPWLATTEVIGLNILVWANSKYIAKEDWADISLSTVKKNLQNGFTWDGDSFIMNQFFHPFHGANYYNSARANGLNFWESIPYAFGGSLMWELFMETEPPSYNDFVNTSISGITLGEISNRISNSIIDESTFGMERILREVTSTIINPMNGFNRLIRGEMWKTGEKRQKTNIHFTFAAGTHSIFINKNIDNNEHYLTLRGNLDYGNQFEVNKHKNPFDFFTVQVEANLRNGDDIWAIIASGVITDSKIKLFDYSNNIIGVYKEIDIYFNDVYKFSSTSISSQLVNTTKLSSNLKMQNYFGLSLIIMGATNSAYANEVNKDYNLGPGISGKIGINLKFDENASLYLNYKGNWIHTLSGAESDEFIGLLNSGFSYNLFSQSHIGIEYLIYERFGDYKHFPNTKDSNSALRFYIKQVI